MLFLLQVAGSELPAQSPLPESGWEGYWQTLGALAAVLVLLVVVMRYVLPALPVAKHGSNDLMRVRGSLALEPRKRIYLIESGGRMLMVASSEGSLHLLESFDRERFPEFSRPEGQDSLFARMLKGKRA